MAGFFLYALTMHMNLVSCVSSLLVLSNRQLCAVVDRNCVNLVNILLFLYRYRFAPAAELQVGLLNSQQGGLTGIEV